MALLQEDILLVAQGCQVVEYGCLQSWIPGILELVLQLRDLSLGRLDVLIHIHRLIGKALIDLTPHGPRTVAKNSYRSPYFACTRLITDEVYLCEAPSFGRQLIEMPTRIGLASLFFIFQYPAEESTR